MRVSRRVAVCQGLAPGGQRVRANVAIGQPREGGEAVAAVVAACPRGYEWGQARRGKKALTGWRRAPSHREGSQSAKSARKLLAVIERKLDSRRWPEERSRNASLLRRQADVDARGALGGHRKRVLHPFVLHAAWLGNQAGGAGRLCERYGRTSRFAFGTDCETRGERTPPAARQKGAGFDGCAQEHPSH